MSSSRSFTITKFAVGVIVLWLQLLHVNSFGTKIARFCKAFIAPLIVVGGLSSPALAKDIPLYFGNGCFWHIQHEMVNAEQKVLKREDEQLTSAAGYAGKQLFLLFSFFRVITYSFIRPALLSFVLVLILYIVRRNQRRKI